MRFLCYTIRHDMVRYDTEVWSSLRTGRFGRVGDLGALGCFVFCVVCMFVFKEVGERKGRGREKGKGGVCVPRLRGG